MTADCQPNPYPDLLCPRKDHTSSVPTTGRFFYFITSDATG